MEFTGYVDGTKKLSTAFCLENKWTRKILISILSAYICFFISSIPFNASVNTEMRQHKITSLGITMPNVGLPIQSLERRQRSGNDTSCQSSTTPTRYKKLYLIRKLHGKVTKIL